MALAKSLLATGPGRDGEGAREKGNARQRNAN
jgi:hypothetical protein